MTTTYYPDSYGRYVSEFPNAPGGRHVVDDGVHYSLWQGAPIDENLPFTEVRIFCNCHAQIIHKAQVYYTETVNGNDVERISVVPGTAFDRLDDQSEPLDAATYKYDENFREVREIIKRVRAGTCKVTYRGEHRVGSIDPGPEELHEMPEQYWIVGTMHPFYGHDGFYRRLAEGAKYVAATDDAPARFHFPGQIVETPPRAEPEPDPIRGLRWIDVFKWAAERPTFGPAPEYEGNDAAYLQAVTDAGWHESVPSPEDETHKLYQARVGYGFNRLGVPVTVRAREILEYGQESFGDKRERVKGIARIFKAWDDDNADNTDASYTRVRNWWKGWIGFAWEETETETLSLTLLNPAFGTETTERTVTARAAREWMLGPLENWAIAGIEAFRAIETAATVGTLLETPGRTLGHIKPDGTVGEGVKETGGISDADWNRYIGASYNAAAGIDSPAGD